MESLRRILDELIESGALEVEIDNQDPDRAERYRVNERAKELLRVQRSACLPRRHKRRRKERLTAVEGAA